MSLRAEGSRRKKRFGAHGAVQDWSFTTVFFFLTSVRRTQVIDDESDYFATDSNQWLSKQEREALQKREQELQELRHASRLAKKITIDFAGRQILEEDSGMAEYHSK